MKAKAKTCKQEFIEALDTLAFTRSRYNVFDDFLTVAACAFANSVPNPLYKEREEIYEKVIGKYKPEEVALFTRMLMLVINAFGENTKQDFLGEIYFEINANNKYAGQFFTPYHIAELMSKMVGVDDSGSVCDPTCGSGVMLIGRANALKESGKSLGNTVFYGQDIDETAALMCYIQLCALGLPGVVKVGDSLSDPLISSEELTTAVWLTPAFILSNIKKEGGVDAV